MKIQWIEDHINGITSENYKVELLILKDRVEEEFPDSSLLEFLNILSTSNYKNSQYVLEDIYCDLEITALRVAPKIQNSEVQDRIDEIVNIQLTEAGRI